MRKVVLLLFAAACQYQGTPVPVRGDLQLLAGEWEGTYSSWQTGRTGGITFQLKAGTDSAYGDVVMVPRNPELGRPPNQPEAAALYQKRPRAIQISFIACEAGSVTGQLEPYEDPDTGERLYTTFEGRLQGKRFLGSFVTFYSASGYRVTGEWRAERRSGDK